MHPYEMGGDPARTAQEESIKLRYGSLYTEPATRFERTGLIHAGQTSRKGNRPERTTYEIGAAGETEMRIGCAIF